MKLTKQRIKQLIKEEVDEELRGQYTTDVSAMMTGEWTSNDERTLQSLKNQLRTGKEAMASNTFKGQAMTKEQRGRVEQWTEHQAAWVAQYEEKKFKSVYQPDRHPTSALETGVERTCWDGSTTTAGEECPPRPAEQGLKEELQKRMKLTKQQLKQIIKEELQEQLNGGAGDQYANLIDRLQDMYELWQPQTDEGIQYKDDLGDLINQ
jgi:hypothetical protein